MPHDLGLPLHAGPSPAEPPPELAPECAKTESFFCNLADPHRGHNVPVQSEDRTKISLSCSHFSQ